MAARPERREELDPVDHSWSGCLRWSVAGERVVHRVPSTPPGVPALRKCLLSSSIGSVERSGNAWGTCSGRNKIRNNWCQGPARRASLATSAPVRCRSSRRTCRRSNLWSWDSCTSCRRSASAPTSG